MLTTTHHDFCLLSCSAIKKSIHCIREADTITCVQNERFQEMLCVRVRARVCMYVRVCGGWAAVASASLVAKRAALPELYLKPERTALWTGKGERQNPARSSRGAEPGQLRCARMHACLVCVQHTNKKQIREGCYGKDTRARRLRGDRSILPFVLPKLAPLLRESLCLTSSEDTLYRCRD